MHRIDTAGSVAGAFTDGNPATATPATVVDDDFMNAVQDELVAVIETAGITLEKGTNDQLLEAIIRLQRYDMAISCSDLVTALTTGETKGYAPVTRAFRITASEIPVAGLLVASTSGAVNIDIKKNGVSIFSTQLTIDQDEDDSTDAATPAVLTGTIDFAVGDRVTVDIDGAGTGAKGLVVTLRGRLLP